VLAALWLVPWDVGQFPVHMLRHMGLVAVVAPLLVLGFPRALAPLAINPLVAAAIEFVVVWAWHLPVAHAAARLGVVAFAVEQAAFLLAGLLVWAGALGARQPLAGAGGLLLTSMHMTLLGAILVLAPRDLYAELCGTAPDLTGQQLGGLLMLGIGTPVYLAGGLWLVSRALRREATA
jgi:putative membrane protein